jgi:hypothetical protein
LDPRHKRSVDRGVDATGTRQRWHRAAPSTNTLLTRRSRSGSLTVRAQLTRVLQQARTTGYGSVQRTTTKTTTQKVVTSVQPSTARAGLTKVKLTTTATIVARIVIRITARRRIARISLQQTGLTRALQSQRWDLHLLRLNRKVASTVPAWRRWRTRFLAKVNPRNVLGDSMGVRRRHQRTLVTKAVSFAQHIVRPAEVIHHLVDLCWL